MKDCRWRRRRDSFARGKRRKFSLEAKNQTKRMKKRKKKEKQKKKNRRKKR